MRPEPETKAQLRAIVRARLAAFAPAVVDQRSGVACESLATQPEYRRSNVIMSFLSLPDEIDTTRMIITAWQDGKRVLAPRVDWEQHRLIPVELNSLTDGIEPTRWNLRQPIRGDALPLDEIDLVLVPGVAFDLAGNRLGRGRGFYDRFLAQPGLRGLTCGLAFDEQILPTLVVDPHDIRIQMLVTDRRVHRFH